MVARLEITDALSAAQARVAARQDTSTLLHRLTDDDLTRPVPTVVGEQDLAAVFGWGMSHPADHLAWIQQGLRSLDAGPATESGLG